LSRDDWDKYSLNQNLQNQRIYRIYHIANPTITK